MNKSREYLYERLRYVNEAIDLEQVADKTIHDSPENEVARILRRGLGISCFVIMEDFIKSRTGECLEDLSKTGIKFSDLPFEMISASSLSAISALKSKSELIFRSDKEAAIDLIQKEAKVIASPLGAKFKFSKLSFASTGSNVTANDIISILKSFGIKNGWSVIRKISHSIGASLPDPCETYKNASTNRNKSAHTPNFNYQLSLLKELPAEIRAICFSLDIALTARCNQVKRNPNSKAESHNIDDELKYLFLRQGAAGYERSSTPTGPATKSWSSIKKAISELKNQARDEGRFLINLNTSKKPIKIIS